MPERMSWAWIWSNSAGVELQDSKVRRIGWSRVNVHTRGLSGCESGHSRGVGLERFFWVWMNFCRAWEDKWVFLAMAFFFLSFAFGGKDLGSECRWMPVGFVPS